jgi:hypothetical protein
MPVAPVLPAAAPAVLTAAPAVLTAPAAAPGPVAAPAFVDPAAPAPTAAPAAGFVLPGATPVLTAPAPSEEEAAARVGRHADILPEPPKAPAAPAPRPVGYTASADPDIANRYRAVIHAADQAPPPPVEPQTGSWPAQQPSSFPSSATSYAAPSYAAYESTSNRAAKAALTSGFIGLVASGLVVGSRLVDVGLPGELIGLATLVLVPLAFITGLVAIITGIVGLVVARRARTGRGAALGGLLLGILLVVVLPVGFVALMLLFAQALGVLA